MDQNTQSPILAELAEAEIANPNAAVAPLVAGRGNLSSSDKPYYIRDPGWS